MRTIKSVLDWLILGLRRAIQDEAVMQKSTTALLALALLGGTPSALAQGELKLQESAPDRHVVERGDTLWSISSKFLSDPWRWPAIWRMNQEQIRNPHLIYPGDVIVLDRSVSPPQLRLESAVRGGATGDGAGRDGVAKLSPKVYSESLGAAAIPSISPRKIEPFLTHPLIIEEGGLDNAPRIIAAEENRVNLGPQGIAYVSGVGAAESALWQVYRPGRPLVDPDSSKTLGIEAVFLGTVRVTRNGEPATVQIMTSEKEITAGDRLVPAPPPTIPLYVPHAPATAIQGRIIGLYDALATSVGGRDSIISINKGKRDGLELGHVLAVYRNAVIYDQRTYTMSRDSARAIQIPPERYGLVFIFRTFDAVSYALVMESSRPIQPGDIIQTP
jgi:hypothetical protein